MPGSRQDNFRVSLRVEGDDFGVFDSFSGGETDSDDPKHRAGGMGPEEALGGPPSVGNITIARNYRRDRGDAGVVRRLRNNIGRGRAVVRKQSLDPDGNPFGEPDVYRGILKRITPPEHDSNSADPALLEVEVTCDQEVG